MKFKYMLRGFGIGVLFAALILAFSFYHKENSLSDAEIMARASKLGMVKAEDAKGMATDNQELSEQLAKEAAEKKDGAVSGAGLDAEGTEEAESSETAGEEEKKEVRETAGSRAGEMKEDSEAAGSRLGEMKEEDSEVAQEETGEMNAEEQESEGSDLESREVSTARVVTDEEVVSIHVEPGMYSSQVTEMLEENGVVKDGADLDWYLCEKNYAPNIQAGDFLIPKDADYEKIAKILTRQ